MRNLNPSDAIKNYNLKTFADSNNFIFYINKNGRRLIAFCNDFGLNVLNGFYQHKNIHRYTWNTEYGTDHIQIIAKILIKPKNQMRNW